MEIGSQTWMAQNLNYTPTSAPDSSWCYNNDTSYCTTYGRLCDYTTALTACPAGWHLPTTTDWDTLEAKVGGISVAGAALMSKADWGVMGTDTYGFSALPGGGYNGSQFSSAGTDGNWWTATLTGSNAYYQDMYQGHANVYIYPKDPTWGFSVRCIMD